MGNDAPVHAHRLVMTDSTLSPGVSAETRTELRTFLFADVRGYTRFTQEHGNEAAARLVSTFAAIMRAGARARGGRVIELRGDEALAVFGSARQALRAAVDLQKRFAEESDRNPLLPLRIGMGLDAGEAVQLEDGYRGEALNLAARLCNLAGPGEVLATEGVVYLGRRVEGVVYARRGLVQMKGFADPVTVIRVLRSEEAPGTALLDLAVISPAEMTLPIGGFLGALPSGALVGREREWEQIMTVLDAVSKGSGRLLLLSGEPGVGKTRLAQELTLKARHWHFLVATGRCYEVEQSVPFYPFLEALATIYAASPASVRAEIPGRWPYLARLLPDQLGLPPAADGGAPDGTPPFGQGAPLALEDQQRLFRAVTGFLTMVAETMPLALLLDDLHWADDSSLKLLQHLARYTRGQQILLVGTYRDIDVHRQHPLETALHDLAREQLVEEVDVPRLTAEGTMALLAEILGVTDGSQGVPADLVELVYRRTEGNAFFIQELMRSLVEQGELFRQDGHWERRAIDEMEVPKSIRSAIGQRLSHLVERSQQILREASVLGQELPFDDLLAFARHIPETREGPAWTEDEIEQALEQGIEAGLVRETAPDRYAFIHALTQQALYAELSTRRRKRLHLAAARALAEVHERPASGRGQRAAGYPLASVAWHFLEGDDAEEALRYALLAGDQAEEVFANGDAERHYRIALELAEEVGDREREVEALEKLGGIVTILGRYDQALELLERAAALHRDAGDTEKEACAVAQVGHVHFLRQSPEEGIARLQPLVDARDGGPPTFGLASLWSALARLYVNSREHEKELHAADRAVALARSLPASPAAARLLIGAEVTRSDALWELGQEEETLRVIEDLIRRAEAAGDLDNLARVLGNVADYHSRRGELEKDRLYQERALAVAERRGDRFYIAMSASALSQNAFLRGDWPLAHAYLDRYEETVSMAHAPSLALWPAVARRWLALREGDTDAAVDGVTDIISLAESLGHDDYARLATRILAERDLSAAASEPDAAWRARVRLEALLDQPGAQEDSGFLWTLAWTHLETGDDPRARDLGARAVQQARAKRGHAHLVEALIMDGRVLAVQGDREAAEARFSEARSRAQSMPFPFGEGRALYEWGLLGGFQGEGVRAGKPGVRNTAHSPGKGEQVQQGSWGMRNVPLLEEALAIFRRLGARGEMRRAEEALARAHR